MSNPRVSYESETYCVIFVCTSEIIQRLRNYAEC